MSTTSKPATTLEPMRIVLRSVPWEAYKALRDDEANNHIRMTYLDGTLQLMSPEYLHDKVATRLAILVRAVARAFGVTYHYAGSTTFRRRRRKPRKGHGLEADESFYFGDHAERIASKDTIDLRTDPPPDLAIEVDNAGDSRWKLKVYARLRFPEVWIYDVDASTLWFGRLLPNRKYESMEQSQALPMLSRTWALEVVTRGQGLPVSRFESLLEGWIRDELTPPNLPPV